MQTSTNEILLIGVPAFVAGIFFILQIMKIMSRFLGSGDRGYDDRRRRGRRRRRDYDGYGRDERDEQEDITSKTILYLILIFLFLGGAAYHFKMGPFKSSSAIENQEKASSSLEYGRGSPPGNNIDRAQNRSAMENQGTFEIETTNPATKSNETQVNHQPDTEEGNFSYYIEVATLVKQAEVDALRTSLKEKGLEVFFGPDARQRVIFVGKYSSQTEAETINEKYDLMGTIRSYPK
jgi:hypothetical protein